LVQGADHAFYTFSFTTQHLTVEADYDCDLKDGGALCSALDPSSHSDSRDTICVDVSFGP
jgi:hypothetical protein